MEQTLEEHESDSEFEDQSLEFSPKPQAHEVEGFKIRVERADLTEVLVHVSPRGSGDGGIPASCPIVDKDYSLEPDFKMGWRPDTNFEGAPIPLRFDYEDERIECALDQEHGTVVYRGFRPIDSLEMHEKLVKDGYQFQFPSKSVYRLLEITRQYASMRQEPRKTEGMVATLPPQEFIFDSQFEEGNLDLAVKRPGSTLEYDLYMRVDTNSRGHHQWFYFSVQNHAPGIVKFNIMNFTKDGSLYEQGMRIAIFSTKKSERASQGLLPPFFSGWHRGGENIRINKYLFIKS